MHGIIGERFLSRNLSAWHDLGTVFREDETVLASEAVTRVAGDVLVTAEPLSYLDPEGQPVSTDHSAIVRHPLPDDPDSVVLGIVSGRWHHDSFCKLSKSLDPLSKSFRLETAGLIDNGGLLFLAFRGDDFSVAGDEMKDFFVANLSATPGVAHTVLASPVRVVCSNTNLMARDRSTINLRIPHSQSAASRLTLASDLVSEFKSMSKKTQAVFELFAKTTIDSDGVEAILQAAFPTPSLPTELRLFQSALSSAESGALEKTMGSRFAQIVTAQEAHERKIERVLALRDVARDHYGEFDPAPLRGTAWAAYNTVTELSDHREGRSGVERSSLFGGRANEKTRAFAETLSLCK